MIKVVSKAYGKGELINYDKRFPGYFDCKFNIKGKDVIIQNMKLHDFDAIIENHEGCKCFFNDYIDSLEYDRKDGKFTRRLCKNECGKFYHICHSIFIDNNITEYWDVYFDEMMDEENHYMKTYTSKPVRYDCSKFKKFNFLYM